MLTLRLLAILSNLAFICYGIIELIVPVLCLHAILLPLNIARLWQLVGYSKPSGPGLREIHSYGSGTHKPIERNRWAVALMTEGQAEHIPRPVVRVLRLVATWREHERHRRELALMSVRDFGDIAVPPGLIREEEARWPWQAMNQGWAALRASDARGTTVCTQAARSLSCNRAPAAADAPATSSNGESARC